MTSAETKKSGPVLSIVAWVLFGIAIILLIATVVSYTHEPQTRTAADFALPLAVTVAALAALWVALWRRLWNTTTTGMRVRNIVLGVIVTFILITLGATVIEDLATRIAGLFVH